MVARSVQEDQLGGAHLRVFGAPASVPSGRSSWSPPTKPRFHSLETHPLCKRMSRSSCLDNTALYEGVKRLIV